MTKTIQCDNCGAVLFEVDAFCGECGAPRPTLAQAVDAVEPEPASAPAPDLPPASQPAPAVPTALEETLEAGEPATAVALKVPKTGWRVAAITLIVLGALACVAGLAAFLIFGSTPSPDTTPQEDWIYATTCCLLPIGGSGAILATIGGIIWYTRLREK
jgi:hypothetical protein